MPLPEGSKAAKVNKCRGSKMTIFVAKLQLQVTQMPTRVAKLPSVAKMPTWGRKNAKVHSKITHVPMHIVIIIIIVIIINSSYCYYYYFYHKFYLKKEKSNGVGGWLY